MSSRIILCIDQGAFFIYRSERDIRQIQPDQKYTPTIQPDQKLQPDQKQQKVPNQEETTFFFLFEEARCVFIQIWHTYRHIHFCR